MVQEPQFLPWAGFWHRAFASDVVVTNAGVKFDKYDHQQRVTIGGSWLTAKIQGGQRSKLIKDVRLTDDYVQALGSNACILLNRAMTSKPSLFWGRLDPLWILLQKVQFKFLLDLDFATTQCLANILGCKVEFVIDLNPREGFGKLQRLDHTIEQAAKGRPAVYLSGSGARKYMGFDSLLYPTATLFQKVHPGTSSDSIVQLIAEDPDPAARIAESATWVSRFSPEVSP